MKPEFSVMTRMEPQRRHAGCGGETQLNLALQAGAQAPECH